MGTHHFAWEMAFFEDLQAMVRHLKAKGVDIVRVRENTYSVDVYIHDPDGNGIDVCYEEPGGYRRAWEGQYARKLLVRGPNITSLVRCRVSLCPTRGMVAARGAVGLRR